MVDSGLKTMRGVVTDSDGRKATASVDMYVILATGTAATSLRASQPYQLFGHLLTILGRMQGTVGALIEVKCEGVPCEDLFVLLLEVAAFEASMEIGIQTGREEPTGRFIRSHLYSTKAGGASERELAIAAQLDAIAASVGQLPVAEERP